MEDQRTNLDSLIHIGKVAAHKRLHAEILLKADMSDLGAKWNDDSISEAFGISTHTVERVRKRLVQKGLEAEVSPQIILSPIFRNSRLTALAQVLNNHPAIQT